MDLLSSALDGEPVSRGTTNVDLGIPIQSALLGVQQNEKVKLSVGRDEVKLDRGADSIIEKKVLLPLRWIKGMAEVQAYQARMEQAFEISRIEAIRFIRGLPRGKTSKTPIWVVPAGKGLRLSQSETTDGVKVLGLERLRSLEKLVHHATGLRIFTDDTSGASAWQLDTVDSRFTNQTEIKTTFNI